MSTCGGGRAWAELLSKESCTVCRGFCPAWAGWGKAAYRPAGPGGLRGRGAVGLCLGLFLEVLVLLVRSEEGFLLECRIPCAGRLL